MAENKRILVIGAGGFVGRLVTISLQRSDSGPAPVVVAAARENIENLPAFTVSAILDVTDDAAVRKLVADVRPTAVIHLAAVAAPAQARADPQRAWQVNVLGTLSVATALMRHAPDARLVFAGSSEAYGEGLKNPAPAGSNEGTALRPLTTYAATKAAADLMLGAMARDGLNAVRFRPFNHTGPGQSGEYVVPAFAKQIARIERGLQEPVITVGNLDAERDFLDARDVARAYVAAALSERDLAPGIVLNLASGRSVRIEHLLRQLIDWSAKPVEIVTDPKRLRPNEVPVTRGDASEARRVLGWKPEIPFEVTLRDVLSACRAEAH